MTTSAGRPMPPEPDDAGLPTVRVVLIGMMGSGKSSVGRVIAQRTGWPFVDNDELVERATGRTARELSLDGEATLRDAESAALHAGLSVDPPAVIGIAAGALMDPVDRRAVARGGFVAWLRASPEVLAARAVGAHHRPWLDADPLGWFRRTGAERDPLYAEVADVEVDTGSATPDEAAAMILAALSERRAGSVPSAT